jgi:ADP-ribose pyrophosphatase YjhB (NUDIX family)
MSVDFKYCPRCAKPLEEQEIFGALRKVCSDREGCGFILFLEPKLVAVVLVEHEGKILLGRRVMNPGKGLWSFPSGYVDRYEKVEEAALREVKEETNLDVALKGLVGVYSENGNPVVLMVFRASVVGSLEQMTAQPEEVSELQFFGLDHLPELAFPFDLNILQDWKNSTS